MVKVVYSSGEEFNINMKKVLKQIVFELYRFHKITDDLLKDNNQDVIKAVLNSEKFEKYVHGNSLL